MQQEIFPREVTSNVPRLTLTGQERLLVEQHRGLENCTASEIGLRTGCGLLKVAGRGLLFLRYTPSEALITGKIESILYAVDGRKG